MDEGVLRESMLNLVHEINDSNGNEKLAYKQQAVKTGNMSLIGGNGRLRVQPRKDGFIISLSCKSLENEMTGFMNQLVGRERDGYKQPNERQPYWITDDLGLLTQAVYRYAQTIP